MKTINLKPRSLILINPSEEKAPEIKLKNSNTKRKLTEKQLDALAKGRQKRTQNLKNNKNKNIIANISKKHNNLLEELPKQNKTIKNKENKENINTSNKHNNLLEELPKQNSTIKITPDKATIKDINSEQYNMKTWQANPEDEKKIKSATDEINEAKKDIEKWKNYIIKHKQKLKELEEELKELKEERSNLSSKKKIKAIDQKIDAVEFNIEQTKEGIGRCINQIESCEFIINHRTKYINNLLKK